MKEKKRIKKTVRCEMCGEMFTPQGIAGHFRWAHLGERTPKLQLEPKREAPALVKPALPIKALEAMMDRAELADHADPSPCCSARLRSAKRVLGVADLALDRCFICARCGEWYCHRPEGVLLAYMDSRGATIGAGVTYIEHLQQEPYPESAKRPGIGSIFQDKQ